jgi:CSLREA domain-containing protein
VFLVTKTADTDDGVCGHDCSLREAVTAANLAKSGVIVIGPGVHTLTLPGAGEDMAQTGDLDVTGDLVILGDGADRTVLDGNGIDRVLDVRSTGSLELYDATVRNGRARLTAIEFGDGGGIRSSGPLTLVRAQVTANRSDHDAGGVLALELAARGSTFSGNIANHSGGGLAAELVEMENVTVSGNQAGDRAGGVLLYFNSAVLRNATITGNSASIGGGLSLFLQDCAGGPCSGYLELQRTLIAGNSGHTRPDCWDLPAHAGAFNLFGVGEGCAPGLDDRAGTLANPLDPRLTPLSGIGGGGGGGGPTPTHALLPDSPAIDLVPADLPGHRPARTAAARGWQRRRRGPLRCRVGRAPARLPAGREHPLPGRGRPLPGHRPMDGPGHGRHRQARAPRPGFGRLLVLRPGQPGDEREGAGRLLGQPAVLGLPERPDRCRSRGHGGGYRHRQHLDSQPRGGNAASAPVGHGCIELRTTLTEPSAAAVVTKGEAKS